METKVKIKELKASISELQILIEDYVNLHDSKKSKIDKLEIELNQMKVSISKYVDQLEILLDEN